MKILSFPTIAAPAGLVMETAVDFRRSNHFPPELYPDWLALVGKIEASVGGIGVGSATASKLLGSFGSVEGIEAAARCNQLKSWGPKVHNAFQEGSPALLKLRRNKRLFQNAASTNYKSALSPSQISTLSQAIARCGLSSIDAQSQKAVALADDLAWAHPLHAARWHHVSPYVERLARTLSNTYCHQDDLETFCKVGTASAGGLPVDLMLGKRCIMVCCECDFHQHGIQAAKRIQEGNELRYGGGGAEEFMSAFVEGHLLNSSSLMLQQLNVAMRHHVSQLRKARLEPCCIPWWLVPSSQNH